MIDSRTSLAITRLHAEGASLRKISQATGFAINTVRAYIKNPLRNCQPKPRQIRPSKLDCLCRDEVEQLFESCKGNYEAMSMVFKSLMEERGHSDVTVSRSTMRRFVRSRYPDLIKPHKPDPATFEVEPGQQLQIDFVECKFKFSGHAEETKIKVFEAIYSFSRRAFIWISPDLTQKSWLTGISRCLAKWGVPRQILCDNDVGLVRRGNYTGQAKFNPRFLWLCNAINVRPVACRPLRPQTKGRVERLGGTLKRQGLAIAQSLVDMAQSAPIHTAEDLQRFLDNWLLQLENKPRFKMQGQDRLFSTNELYEMERSQLLFPDKLDSLLKVATYPINISRHGTVHLHGTRIRVGHRYACSRAEVTFQADGSFFITTESGSPILSGSISQENLHRYRWDDRAPDASVREETTAPESLTEPCAAYFEQIDQILGNTK